MPIPTSMSFEHGRSPIAKGFVYLASVLDWFSRRVLSWRVSITLEAAICVKPLEEALARYGRPETFNMARSSPAWRSPVCLRRTTSGSAWTARARDRTTCSSSCFGGP